jgi:hypothetical protein
MQWTKQADVTPGEKNKDIKPGTTDSGIGKDYKEEDKPKIMDEPKGDQKEPKETAKPDEAIGAEYKRTDNQEQTSAPEGDQKAVPQKTHVEAPAKDIRAWLKNADATPGTPNKTKPGTTDEAIGYEYKENEGEKTKVLDEPEGDQKAVPQKTTTDNKIGEEYKEEGNQEKTPAPEGDQKPVKSETHESDVSGEEYKEDGAKKISPKDASLGKLSAWLKNPVTASTEEGSVDPALPERYASFSDMADEYATLFGFYTQATGENVDTEMFGKALAHIGLQSSNAMVDRIDKIITTIARTLDRVKPRELSGWKEAIGGFYKREGTLTVLAKDKEEAGKIDRCVESKMGDQSFKPQKGRTKKESAFAICTKSVMGTSVAPAAVKEIVSTDKAADLAKVLVESFTSRLAKDKEFAGKFAAIKGDKDVSAVCVELATKLAKLADNVDLIRLANYRFDCAGCYDAIIGNIEKGLVPSDFQKK